MVSNCTAAILAISLLASLPQPLVWEADYNAALEATRADSQPLLVVIDDPASDEKRLHPELLGEGVDSGTELDLLEDYRLCHVDATTDHGKKVVRAFHAEQLPFTAIIDKTGSVIIFSKAGKIASGEWQELLETHRDGERGKTAATSRISYKISQDGQQPIQIESMSGGCTSCQRRSM